METIRVKLTPGAKENSVLEQKDGRLKVQVKARPIEGQANQALIELLSEHFGCYQNQIVIVKGFRSREKLVKILR